MKAALYRIHRWLGMSLGILVTLWFTSGFIMMYVGFPYLSTTERLAGLPDLPSHGWTVSPARALAASGQTVAPVRIRLGDFLGWPVYHLRPADGSPWVTVTADDGRVLPPVSDSDAVQQAMRFHRDAPDARHDGLIHLDQWTVPQSLEPYRPLHRIRINDRAGTVLYVSARTGEVVRDTARTERFLNWFGAVTHWIYPAWLRQHTGAWRLTIQILSGTAFLLPLSGLCMGFRRARTAWRQLRGIRRWHILLGTVFGFLCMSWLASGFLSIRSTWLFDDGEPTQDQHQKFAGGALDARGFTRSIPDLLRSFSSSPAKEAELLWVVGRPYVLVRGTSAVPSLLPGDKPGAPPTVPDVRELETRARQLLPDDPWMGLVWLTDPDAHLASTETNPLPIGRARFGDPQETWFHIDPTSGRLTERLTRRSRAYRWLFNGVHNFDWPWLASRRPLWDGVVLMGLTGGLATSLLGLRLAWKRVRSLRP